MEFRLLGPLEVTKDGEPVVVRGRIHPRLLTTLALECGNTVSISALIDSLWDVEPPDTARRQVQNAAAALRRLFDGGIVESAGQGYRLAVDPSSVDIRRFHASVAEAKRERREGRASRALEIVRDGLTLWRGAALADFAETGLAAYARSLEDARLSAIEERIDLELEVGHTPPTAELRELVANNPTRQRLIGLLMLALYREGRTPDALHVYERSRQRLADSIGIDPSPALRGLHTAILREDPDLNAPAIDEPQQTAPAQLPADIAGFTGREAQLDQLDELLSSHENTAILSTVMGSGGAGKTALAIHWAHRNRNLFPDGQLYINLRGFDHDSPMTPLDALRRFLQALGHPSDAVPSDVDAAAELYRSLIADRRQLIVLDNARDAKQVRPLLPGSGGSLTLVTSRNRLASLTALDGARPIPVDTLDQTASLELLATVLGPSRPHAEPLAARRLARLCGGLPLALRIVGANLTVRPDQTLAEFAVELESSGPELMAVDGDPDAAVMSSFDLSFQALEEPARQLFLYIGLNPGQDFSTELAAVMGDLDEPETRKLLARLESMHLIERHTSLRFRLHDLIRLYANRLATETMDSSQVNDMISRCIDWYHDNQKYPDPDDFTNIRLSFETWRDHPLSWRLTCQLSTYWNLGCDRRLVGDYILQGLRLAESQQDPYAMAWTNSAVGMSYLRESRMDLAISHQRRAVELSEQTGDRVSISKLSHDLGSILINCGKNSEAISAFQRSLEMTLEDQAEESVQVMNVRTSLANAYRCAGRFREAEELLTRCRDIADDHAMSVDQTDARLLLALTYLDWNRVDRIWRLLDEMAELAEKDARADRPHHFPMIRGNALRLSGRLAEAEAILTEILEIAQRTDNRMNIESIHVSLVELWCAAGDFDAAQRELDHIDLEATKDDDDFLAAICDLLAGMVLNGCGDHTNAARRAELARESFALQPDPRNEARSLDALAEALEGLGRAEEGTRAHEQARAIYRRLGFGEVAAIRPARRR